MIVEVVLRGAGSPALDIYVADLTLAGRVVVVAVEDVLAAAGCGSGLAVLYSTEHKQCLKHSFI